MRRTTLAALLSLLLLPLVWLWPCIGGGRTFVSFDLGQFPPSKLAATDEQLREAHEHANFDVTEVPAWFAPELRLAAAELRAGRWPTWNPHARTGAPLHAHGLLGLCYPPNWLALSAADPEQRLAWVAWLNLAIGGLLAFGLFRQLGFGLVPAWLGAALFELSGPMAANAFFWMRLASLVWLPGVLWAMLRVAAHERLAPRALLALALCFAMTWLGGFPPFAATTTVFAGLAGAWLVGDRWRTHGRRPALALAGALAVGVALGACFAAPQVLPSLWFFPHSARPPVPEWRDIAGQTFDAYGLLGYLLPDAFGDPTTAPLLPYDRGPLQLLLNTRTLLDGTPTLPDYNWTEYTVALSTLGCVLAAIGLGCGRGRRVWLARSAWLFALGLGMFWPGLQLLFHLPVVQNAWPLRWPSAATPFAAWLAASGAERVLAGSRRLSVIAGAACCALAVAVWQLTALPARRYAEDHQWLVDTLAAHYRCQPADVVNHVQGVPQVPFDRAAMGLEQFAASGATGAWWLLGTGLMLLFVAFATPRARAGALLAGGSAALVQLALLGAPVTRGAAHTIPIETAVHAFLREAAGAAAAPGGFTIVRAGVLPGVPDQLPPGELLDRGIRDLNFYSHADRRTLQPLRRLLERYAPEIGLSPDAPERIAGRGYLTQSLPAALLAHPWFDLLGVRFVLTTELLDGVGSLVGPPMTNARGEFYVYERRRALPRAFVVPTVVPLADDDAVLAALTDPQLAPRRQAFVVAAECDSGNRAGGDGLPRDVAFTVDEPTRVEIDVGPGNAPWLVLTDTFLPGWSATVDGTATPIVRANHSQRAVPLPPNACRVVVTYRAPGLAEGTVLLVLAALGWSVLAFATARRARAAAAAG